MLGLIAATRVVLDVAEALVRDPRTAAHTAAVVGQVAKAVVQAAAQAARAGTDGESSELERIDVT